MTAIESNGLDHRFCIAPMMDWSDRHCRYFWRLLTRRALVYTEMVTTGALIHGDRQRFLHFDEREHPVALQLGGSDPGELARCAAWAEEWGYNEVNLNCGCPSDRVQSGRFGACLMAEPDVVARAVAAMRDACGIPLTVKHRIGIDAMENFQQMLDFVLPVAEAGCRTFIVHARKAWLQGLSPKQNREIPPLRYDWVYRLKQEQPELEIVINGGITTLEDCERHLQRVDGVMLGREAYLNPHMLASVDQRLFDETAAPIDRDQVLLDLIPYVERELSRGARLHHVTRHILGLYQNVPGARKFRRHLSENAYREGAGLDVLEGALGIVREAQKRMAERAA
jgi:tRNA-dihydrouridine synthase A